MDLISIGTIFYIIENLILPLGSFIILLIFLLFFVKLINKDQIDIFYNAQFMEPKKAKSYLEQIKKEKLEKEFETLLNYKKLFDSHKKEYLKLREEGIGVRDIVAKLNPNDEEKK